MNGKINDDIDSNMIGSMNSNMDSAAFNRLAPFIREYVYTHGWTELRPIQVEACKAIFGTDSHLLLASGTASGKTEAAFLPVLTLLSEAPSSTVGVLYIGPLKALINDQFNRLEGLLQEADIPVWHWHGDVSQAHKGRFLKNPSGILQITPESLESMLINRSFELTRFFGDLRFIIIDEIHAFMGTDRGSQILCQLQRLERYLRVSPRRIGLSATLGDYTLAEQWLASGTRRPVVTPEVKAGQQMIRLALEHFSLPRPENQVHQTIETNSYWEYIFDKSHQHRTLIFSNTREYTELTGATLRYIAEQRSLPDIYHVHHGSIAASLREDTETLLRESPGPIVTVATLSLELGIDIGQLERIIQLEAPFTVSSFLQRLGRSGRRGKPSEMWFVCREDTLTGYEAIPYQIPWHFLQAIAIIQLYLEERWIEPPVQPKYPYSLLYHQIMSTLASLGELSPPALAQHILTLSPFRDITQDDLRDLLRHLVNIGHIQQTEDRGLIIGLEGSRTTGSFSFYAVFQQQEQFTVKVQSKEIGKVEMPPPPGEVMVLAGRVWQVQEVDLQAKSIQVIEVKGDIRTWWNNERRTIHTRIIQKMQRILLEDTDYPYLQKGARERLGQARRFASSMHLGHGNIFSLGGGRYCILPWLGSAAFSTLERWLRYSCMEEFRLRSVEAIAPYYIIVHVSDGNIDNLRAAIKAFLTTDVTERHLIGQKDAIQKNKFDEFIPEHLLRKAFLTDRLAIDELHAVLRTWI